MDLRKFVLRLRARKLVGNAVQNCAHFLRSELNRQGTIIQGYCITQTANPERFQYYWVEDLSGNVYDISFAVACVTSPEVEGTRFVLTKDAPEKFESDPINTDTYKQYIDDPKTFWSSLRKF
jgi:hypothetical protein